MNTSEIEKLKNIKDKLGNHNPNSVDACDNILFICKQLMDVIDIIVKEDPLSKKELIDEMQRGKST